jgi:hypothetical protein
VLDIRLAFGEGFGTAFGAMVLADPIYRDSYGPGQASGFSINSEDPEVTAPGWWNEDSVAAILYDIYDATDDGADTLSAGFVPIYQVMVNGQRTTDALTSIFTFLDEYIAGNEDQADQVRALASSQNINGAGIDSYGEGETNLPANDPGGDISLLPLYRQLPIGLTVEACSIIDLDPFSDGSMAGIFRFLILDIENAGNYRIIAARSSGRMSSDPDLYLYQRGDVRQAGESPEVDSETIDISNLEPGRYILTVNDFYNYLPEPMVQSGNVCFDVTATVQ